MAAEGMDRSGAGQDFAAVRHAAGDEILLAGFQGNPFAVDDQRVAALHHDHVFVEVVDMRCGGRGLGAGPEGHLAAVGAIEDIAFDAGGGLAGGGDAVGRLLHELGEFFHGDAAPSGDKGCNGARET